MPQLPNFLLQLKTSYYTLGCASHFFSRILPTLKYIFSLKENMYVKIGSCFVCTIFSEVNANFSRVLLQFGAVKKSILHYYEENYDGYSVILI